MSFLTLIDTSAWIFALGDRSNRRIKERIAFLVEQNLACITSPIAFELLSGVKSDSENQRLKSYLSTIHPFPFMVEEWSDAAEWVTTIRKKGVKVKTIDALIAYKAVKHKLTLLHADTDLDRLAKKTNLHVESFVDAAREGSRSSS